MGLTIYIWIAENVNVGHAAMTLSDGTYISWWPRNARRKHSIQNSGDVSRSYGRDVERKGKFTDHMYEIPTGILDEEAIYDWWDQFRDKGEYHLLDNNCCTVVYNALEMGGATRYAGISWSLISTPTNLNMYAKKLRQAKS